MSNSVDDRVVEMRFDNQHFEKNVKTTMSTLDRLKNALSLSGSAKAAQSEFDAYKSGIFSLGDSINKMWSSLEYDVANKMKKLLHEFTLAPITTGFSEYETQINAVQTILANTSSKGTTLDQVNAALDELNKYADLTIYNFTEMTRNIGTFTAAGVDLDTSVSAIQGIANLAAVSGSTSQQASTAMYQLSQALSSGTVKLMDWNSVVNAGMGGQVFQDALKRTAEVMGTDVDALIDKYGSFRETLSTGWITSDVLTETLKQFTMAAEEGTEQWEAYKNSLKEQGYTEEQADEILKMANNATDAATKVKTFTQLMDTLKEAAQSGWTQTWELIVGDFEGAKDLFGNIYETVSGIINEGSDARNKLLKNTLYSNWDKVTEYVTRAGISFDDFQNKVIETATEHGIAIDDIIAEHGSLANAFKNGALDGGLIIETLKKFAGGLTSTTQAAEVTTHKIDELRSQVLRTIRGDFGNGAVRVQKFAEAGMDYATVQGIVNKVFANGVVNYEKLDECLANLSVTQLESMGYTEEQAEVLKELAKQAEETGTPLNDLINDLSKPGGRDLLIDSVKNALNGFVGIIRIVRDAWSKFLGIDSSSIYKVIEAINKFSKMFILTTKEIDENGKEITKLTATGDKLRRVFEGLFAIIDVIRTYICGAFKLALGIVSELFGTANIDILEMVARFGDLLVNFRKFVFENNFVAKAIRAFGNGLVFVITLIEKFIDALMSIPMVRNAIENFKMMFVGTYQSGKDFIIGFINGIKDGSISIIDLLKTLGAKIIERFRLSLGEHSPSKDAYQAASDFVLGFVNGIAAFVKSAITAIGKFGKMVVDKIKSIDWGTVAAVGISVGLLVLFGIIGKAVLAIAKPFKILGSLADGVSKTLKSFSNTLGAVTKTLKAASMVLIAGAITLLVASIIALTTVNPALVWSSVGAIAVLGATLVALVTAMDKVTTSTDADGNKIKMNLMQMSLALLGVASAMLVAAAAIKILSSVHWTDALVALGIFAGLVAGMILTIKAMKKLPADSEVNMLKFSALMLTMSMTLLTFTKTAKQMSKLSVGEIAKGLVALTVLVTELIIFSKMISKDMPQVGSTLLSLGFTLGLLVVVVKMASLLKASTLIKGMAVLIPLEIMMAGLIAMTKLFGQYAAKTGGTILAMTVSMVLLLGVMKTASKLEPGALTKGILAVGALSVILGILIAITRLYGGETKGLAVTLLAMSVSLAILASLAVLLGLVKVENLIKGVTAMSVLMGMMALMIAATKGAQQCKGNLIVLTVALGLMAAAILTLSFIDPTRVLAASVSISLMMGMMALLIKLSSTAKTVNKNIIVTTLVIGALGALVWFLQDIPAETTLAIAGALSLLLISLSASLLLLGKVGNVSKQALTSVAVLAVVIGALGAVIYLLSSIFKDVTLADVGTGLLAMLGAVGIIVIAANLMKSALSGATAMIIMAGAIAILVPSFVSLSSLSLAEIGIGLLALAGTFAVLGVAGLLLGPIAPLILALSGALALFGAACISVGAGVLLLASGLSILAVSGSAGAAALVTVVTGLISLIPLLIQKIGEGVIAFAGVIANGSPAILEAITSVIVAIIGAITNGIKALIKSVGTILDSLIDFVATYVPKFMNLGITLLLSMLQGIADNIGKVITTAYDIIIAFLDAISKKLPEVIQAGVSLIINFINGLADTIRNNTAPMIEAVNNLMWAIIDAVIAWHTNLWSQGKKIVEKVVGGISSCFGEAKKVGKNLIDGVISGISSKISDVTTKAKEMAKSALDAAKKFLHIKSPSRVFRDEVGKYLVEGFAKGIDKNTYKAEDSVSAMSKAALEAAEKELEIASPAKKTIYIGRWFGIGFASGIEDTTGVVETTSGNLSNSALNAMKGPVKVEAKKAGEEAGKAASTGFFGTAKAGILRATDKVANAFDTRNKLKEKGEEGGDSFLDGLSSTVSNFKSKITDNLTPDSAEVGGAVGGAVSKVADEIEELAKKLYEELDLADATIDLKFKLWGGDEANVYLEKHANQLKRIAVAQDKYDSYVKKLGVDAIETKKAYNELMQEYIDLNDMVKAEEDRKRQLILDNLDLADTTLDLKFELWGGDEANVYLEKHATQLERIAVAQEKYDSLVKQLGHDAKETKLAYNELMQEYIDLNNLVKAEEDRKYQHSMDWIEAKKEAGELSLYDELAAYKRVQSQYLEGSENRIKADKEVARVEKEIADANESYYKEVEQIHKDYIDKKKDLDKEYQDYVESMNKQLKDDIKSVWDEYESSVNNRAKSIYGAYGLFDEVAAVSEVDGSTLINNLQSQVDAIEDWKTDINSLRKKGLNKDLLSELSEMGPSAAANIKALNNLSRAELKKYEKLWKEKQSSAREQATLELTGLRNDSLATIRKLRLDSEHELAQYQANVGTQLNQLTTDTDTQLKNAKTTWLETLRIDDPEKEIVKSSFTTMVEDVTTEIGNNKGWSEAGANAINGLVRGVTLNAHSLYETMSETMGNALSTAQSAWAIHSPSREFMNIGKFGVKGLALGFANNAKFVLNAIKEVGSNAISSMSDSIAKIVDVISDDIDTQPTIRPVLDLSDVESKTGRLNAMFSREQAMTISSNRSNATRGEIQNGSETSTNGATYNFTQNNYSPKALSKTDIYRQTKNQFSAMKRMVKA